MIVQKNFLSKLRDFGLNTYESRLWTALLSRGSSTAGELSDIAQVPRSRAYDVLETLEKKGFILREVGKPIKYLAVPPEDVIARIQEGIEKQAQERVDLIESLKGSGVLSELSSLHRQGIEHIEPTDLTGSISGRDNIHHHLAARLAKAEKGVDLLLSAQSLERKMHILVPVAQRLKERGVPLRIATQKDAALDKLAGLAQVKETDIVGRLVIIDGREIVAFLLHEAHPAYDTAIWVNAPFLAEQLSALFEAKWHEL